MLSLLIYSLPLLNAIKEVLFTEQSVGQNILKRFGMDISVQRVGPARLESEDIPLDAGSEKHRHVGMRERAKFSS